MLGSFLFRDNDLLSLGIIECKLSMSMKDGKITIGITMYTNLHPDIVIAILILGDLKDESIEFDTVVVTDCTFILLAENVFDWRPGPWHKHAGCFFRLHGKLIVKGGQVCFVDVCIGLLHVGDTGNGKFLYKTLLVSTKCP